jgi:hypothetical protein
MATETTPKKEVAYVPFKTFLTAIDALENGVPTTVDRSVWPSFSNATRSQLLIAFRFLGLTASDGKATPELERLAHDKENRKATLRKALERSYPELIKHDLTKMTMASLENQMRSYGVTGETYKKAVSFFLQAARYSGLPLSVFILKQTRAVSKGKKRRTTSAVPSTTEANQSGNSRAPEESNQRGPTKTMELRGGIFLTLSASQDMFRMGAQDRQFVLMLLEEMETHERMMNDNPGKEKSK